MGTLDNLLEVKPPDELFHYTSQAGLLGILQNNTLWASKISHLNDAAELVLALKLARNRLADATIDDRIRGQLLDDLDLMHRGSINIFVFSLTENGDQLSQWRGYTPPGSGYSIGFSSHSLQVASEHHWPFTLGPCTYDPEVHDQVISEIVAEAVRRRQSLGRTRPGDLTPGIPFRDALYFAAPFLKHATFAEEREWRLVSRPLSCTDRRFRHRPGQSHLVPYLELSIDPEDVGQLVRRVIIGPTPHPQLASDAVETLLSTSSNGSIVIESSETPFRQW